MGVHQLLSLFLWISPLVLLVAVSVLMFRRGLQHDFPVFFVYTIFESVDFVLMFVLLRLPSVTGNQYAYAFASTMVLGIALRFGVIEEIIANVFRDYQFWKGFPRRYFKWIKISLGLAAVLIAIYAPGENRAQLTGGLAVVNRGVALIQCGLLIFLMCFSRFLGLSWRSYSFGVAFGLGILSTCDLMNSALRANLAGESWNVVLNVMTSGSFLVCVLVWFLYLLAPERKTVALPDSTRDQVEDWNRELREFLGS